jgi:hypothetical protein
MLESPVFFYLTAAAEVNVAVTEQTLERSLDEKRNGRQKS